MRIHMNFTDIIHKQFHSNPDAPAIEFRGVWYKRGELVQYSDRISALLQQAGVSDTAPVGFIVRNRLQHLAVMQGLVAGKRSFSMIYAFQSPEAMAKDVAKLKTAVIVADCEDWTDAVIEAAREAGSIGIAIRLDGERVALVPGLTQLGAGPFREVHPEPGIEVLTSGTTGAPKRIRIPLRVLERAIAGVTTQTKPNPDDPPNMIYWPFGGIGGVTAVITAAYLGSRSVLLEKFAVPEFVNAIKAHCITMVGVQPTVIRMLLEAKVPREDLASLKFIFGGSAPLDPETHQAFEQIYGIPVVWAYGATEFAGTIIAWNYDLYKQYGEAKRGSIGKPFPDVQVRVVDPETGQEVPTGEQGFLEALVPLVKPDWIRTTDIASIDADGFVTLHGRGDGAIIRGGFKVLPETVVKCFLTHPGVLDAAVVGLDDERLGAVPVAAVELRGGFRLTEDQLKAHARQNLPSHHVPVQIRIVDQLPRTPSLKVSLQAVQAMFSP